MVQNLPRCTPKCKFLAKAHHSIANPFTSNTLAVIITVVRTDQSHDFIRHSLEGGISATNGGHLLQLSLALNLYYTVDGHIRCSVICLQKN